MAIERQRARRDTGPVRARRRRPCRPFRADGDRLPQRMPWPLEPGPMNQVASLLSGGPRSSPRVPAHQLTTRNLGAAYPLVAESGLGHRGVLIGYDLLGGSFVYDPFELYAQGVVSNPNMIVFGQIGRGKSGFVKTYLWRQAVFGRRAWVVDPKGEYGVLAEAWGTAPISLRPGGAVRLNPLDPGPGSARRQWPWGGCGRPAGGAAGVAGRRLPGAGAPPPRARGGRPGAGERRGTGPRPHPAGRGGGDAGADGGRRRCHPDRPGNALGGRP